MDGDHGPGLAWNIGHGLFFVSFVLFGVLLVGLQKMIPAASRRSRVWTNAAMLAGLFGVFCFLWVILGDLFPSFKKAAPLPDVLEIGPLLFQFSILGLLIMLVAARPRRFPPWGLFFVVGGFIMFIVNLNLIPVGALLILIGLYPLTQRRH